MAIEHALTILSWFENLEEKDRPPEHLWEDPEGLELWWKHVEERREDGVDTNRGLADPDPNDQTPSLTENDYARFLKR